MRIALVPLFLLAGCATPGGDMNSAKSTWTNAPYEEVVARWGQPQDYTVLSDGGYVYTWASEVAEPRGRVYPSIGLFGGSGGGIGIGTGISVGPGGAELVRCTRTLVFRNGRVAEQTWQGDPAYCESFKR